MHPAKTTTSSRLLRRGCFALLFTCLGAALAIGLERLYPPAQEMISTRKALVIDGPPDDGHRYLLPPGTVLYYETAMPEGHARYRAYFYYKGEIEGDPLPLEPKHHGSLIAPGWLSSPEPDAPSL
ncbi:hypothetical protein [Pseudomonas piscis]|uniref:hypothetical protein n=1 Tax=Pseudomonas piscis TaxID=2614538 RepID=UPI0021D58D3F|nr:hypothetical protein [Pseudomonas piscis]MCU7646946.1 hypothetical protein [Pseudomonas piscis]